MPEQLDDLCKYHQTPMIKEMQHTGDGKSEWSEPKCPLCEELKAAGRYDQAIASIEADAAKKRPKEQPAPASVKADAAAPAAKT